MAPSTHFYGFTRSLTWILLILSQVDKISSLPLQDAAVFPLPQAAVDKIIDVLPDSLYDLPLSVNMLEGRAAMPQSAIVTPSSSVKKSKDATSKTATSLATSIVTSQPSSAGPSDTAGLITTVTSGGLTIQSVIPDLEPGTTGTVISTLEREGESAVPPFNTKPIPTPSGVLQPIKGNLTTVIPEQRMNLMAGDIFQPLASEDPGTIIPRRGDHPAPRTGITTGGSLQTNKFYANFFLGGQTQSTWTHPYSLQWTKGQGAAKSWGVSIAHIRSEQRVFGPGNPAQYYINPIGLHSVIMSAAELGGSTQLTTKNLLAFSVDVELRAAPGAAPLITMPLVQGMGFVSSIYQGATPLIQSDVFFRSIAGPIAVNGANKYRITTEDNQSWLLYATPNSGAAPTFSLTSNTAIRGPGGFRGTIQIAKNPAGAAGEGFYDRAVGAYPTGATISGSVSGRSGSYTFAFNKGGNTARPLIMYALPHHVQSFDGATAGAKVEMRLQTTTKGVAQAVIADRWTMVENNLPADVGFAPWSPARGSATTLNGNVMTLMNNVAGSELNQDFNQQTNLDSMYFSGKGLAKFASVVYAVRDLSKNPGLANAGLQKLKAAFDVFVQNRQKNPLNYETAWRGVVSVAGYRDAGLDFGGTYYNDHHFHYGYFVYAAAVIGYLDPAWLSQGRNKAWVNMLVRDFANSVHGDFFPFSRSFDWYHGHSWAKGLFESADGKDQESTSEDSFASYALKMWGRVTGDVNMEARGNLMLSIQARSFQNYFLMDSGNTNQPAQFIGNKVTGILFENKVDHITYFGANTEYIQGIHMIPLAAPSTLIRTPKFVREEWDQYFSNGRVDRVQGGWRSILYANLAIIDPRAAYNFFANPNFDAGTLDGGASRTWSLAWCAGLGGA
ncbi:endo-1,3-beta glucanase [Coniosporium apollinis]|uniref:glucan endo-1,3-beta-D-glucosidase n=1 Tax=Coniosporium apollinis TaxID=61459 RepID=A0ABQ9NW18_9PEZI|nr:endo-1,3-beta glucanase [Coniosporium apollinis]